MNKELSKGFFIAVEGIDGAGKTTLVNNLRNYYQNKGYKVSTTKEPTDGEYGKTIKRLASQGRENFSARDEFELFLKDREEDCKRNIIPAIERKEIIIADRYYYSSIAYQGALGLDASFIEKENRKIAVEPDLVLIVDVNVKTGLDRIKNSRGETPNYFEKAELLEISRRIFNSLKGERINILDGFKTEKEILQQAIEIVNQELKNISL